MSGDKPMLDDPRDGPWFDEEIFTTLQETVSDEVFERLLRLFLENTSARLDEIGGLDPAREPERLAVALHALRGSAMMIGARQVEALAEDLRAASRDGRAAQIEQGRSRLAEAVARVHRRVREELDEQDSLTENHRSD